MKPQVTAIVTTKNSTRTLHTCLTSIQKQSYPKIQIIVVDNYSSDNTHTIAQSFTPFVFRHGPERSAQRNFGVSQSKGKYLIFLDSDMELSINVVKECVLHAETNNIDALYIPEIISGENIWSQVRTFERSFYNATVIDAVRFIKRTTFEKVDGFDETLTGPEDWDFDKKIRKVGTVGVIENPLYHHEEYMTLQSYIGKKLYYSQNFDRYINKWGKDDRDIQKQFGIYYRFIGVFVENGKWKKLITKPHYAILMYALRILLGTTFAISKLKRVRFLIL